MKVDDIVQAMERIAPLSISKGVCEKFGDYDNSGLLMNFCRGEVDSVLVALDASMPVLSEAVSLGAQMIVTHHPVIYAPVKSVGADDLTTRKILTAAEHGISIFSAHLNLDSAPGGINDQFAALCGLKESRNLFDLDGESGYLRLGELEHPRSLEEYRSELSKSFGPFVRAVGDPDKQIRRVAVVNGGAGGLYSRARKAGADCFVSGDFRHHEYHDALDLGISLIDIPHYDAEKFYMRILAGRLSEALPGISVRESRSEVRPFWQ